MAEVRWTNKLPDLIIGIILAVSGIILISWKRSPLITAVSVLLLVCGLCFIGYSMTIKEWCVANEHSAFSGGFAPSLRGCLRMKGWLEL